VIEVVSTPKRQPAVQRAPLLWRPTSLRCVEVPHRSLQRRARQCAAAFPEIAGDARPRASARVDKDAFLQSQIRRPPPRDRGETVASGSLFLTIEPGVGFDYRLDRAVHVPPHTGGYAQTEEVVACKSAEVR
jgi:hypothetical protein